MSQPPVMQRFLNIMTNWTWSLVDIIPPYRVADGLLLNKETSPESKYIITVNSAKIEVDRNTFDALVIGENLRVRYTRGNRAINIDRILPGRGPV